MKNEQGEPIMGNVQSKRPDAEHIDWSLRYHELMLAMINNGWHPNEAKGCAEQIILSEKDLVD